MMKTIKNMLLFILMAVGIAVPVVSSASESIFTIEVDADFADVRIDIENAIANRGFVVDFQSNIGGMLDRTAADVGSTASVFKHAETWQFCSSILSRKMVEVNPVNIAFCPYIVFAYVTVDEPDAVTIGYRRYNVEDIASKEIFSEINGQLEAIVNDASN